ncbi:hypothetical protein CBM2626_A130173 [Cupriavidus taiwanensis]|nr:hypothetical protein CBM2626_A130173 [Cupriavidus taiwanensis]
MGPAGSGGRATITLSLLGDAPFSLSGTARFFFILNATDGQAPDAGADTGDSLEGASRLGERPPHAETQTHPSKRDQGDVVPVHGATPRSTQFEGVP